METLHTWWATELYPMRERDQFGVSGEFEVALAADAQATIAALQARVKELENPRIATRCPACGGSTLFIANGNWLTCSLIGCPDPTLINSTGERLKAYWSDKQKAESQLTQHTAELEAAKQRVMDERNLSNSWMKKHDELLAKVHKSGQFGAVVVQDVLKERDTLQAELERVRGELQSAEAGYFVAERDLQGVNNKYDELRTLILALPRMEGDVEVYHHESGLRHSVVARPANKYYSSFDTPEEAGAYAAILKHRQGMEG